MYRILLGIVCTKNSTLCRASVWSCLEEVYIGCTSFDPNMRFSLCDVEEVLNNKYDVDNTSDLVKMKMTQTTAIEQRDHEVAIKLSIENDNTEIQSRDLPVTNDGSNACAFLRVDLGKYITNGPKCYKTKSMLVSSPQKLKTLLSQSLNVAVR